MMVEILHKDNKRIKIAIHNESHGFLNFLRKKCYESGAKQAAYIIEHPQVSVPVFVLYANDVKKVLTNSIKLMVRDIDEFEERFKIETEHY